MKISDEDAKWLLYYGTLEADALDIKLDDLGRIDLGIELAFEVLEEQTVCDRKKIEDIFWKRIKAIAEYDFSGKSNSNEKT